MTRSHLYRQLAVLAALGFATAICAVLFVLRIVYTHDVSYEWLIWNLFLAWLPMLSALIAYNLSAQRSRLIWLMVVPCVLFWLLFFPNAPYLVTDLAHLQPQEDDLFWYDLIMISTFVWTGFFLGLVSLFLMQTLVRRMAGRLVGWLFAVGVVGLSSFGIYLGRFLHWNSWDVWRNPTELFADIWEPLRHPLSHLQPLGFSVLFAMFFLSTYLIVFAVAQLQQNPHHPQIDRSGVAVFAKEQ